MLFRSRGCSTKQIASSLNIATKTAACHRMRIMDKLNIHDVAGLTRYAIQNGQISILGQAGSGKTIQSLTSELETAHREYLQAMEAYRVFIDERQDLGVGNPDGITGGTRLFRVEMAAHRTYHDAILALKNLLFADSPRREDGSGGAN